ncbi:hypothetical protein QBC46DRAFT_171470 [Diplogelasinospora grovesii]|uniref:Uncharacterized protein n=1 Tax=Diplogelasinospora grovesii TaxID=303347 RepID=A0AAN6S2D6_9PEZI|nr:hypothetical protein QBC46DRAFT_171470 [Diplogelasinospora grovesii]
MDTPGQADHSTDPAVLDDMESDYWDWTHAERVREDGRLQEKYRVERERLKQQLFERHEERKKLVAQLEALDQQVKNTESEVRLLDDQRETMLGALAATRARDDQAKREFFEMRRQMAQASKAEKEAAEAAAVHGMPDSRTRLHDEPQAMATVMAQPHGQREQTSPRRPEYDAQAVDKEEGTGIEVRSSSGELLGHLPRISPEHHWFKAGVGLLPKRPLQIRSGQGFTAETLESISRNDDAGRAKLLSCYIQATGTAKEKPCAACLNGGGIFPECVVHGVDLFAQCANCEWSGQACQDASPKAESKLPPSPGGEVPTEGLSPDQRPGLERSHHSSGGFTPVNLPTAGRTASASSQTVNTGVPKNEEEVMAFRPKLAGRKSLPNMRNAGKSFQDTPAGSTPRTASPAGDSEMAADEPPDLPEITREGLSLRDDGVVFTDPPCLRGVPLAKISPDHPYWEPEWKSIEELIKPQLDKWAEKYEQLVTQGVTGSSKFLANRQINRGKAIIKFLQEGDLHPYQILAKPFITERLTHYDTVFRMVQVLEELPKFSIDMSPSQWLRQRLHEIYTEMGDNFNLAKTIHHMYHDAKVQALRIKCGFGNIGRPSGYRMGEKGPEGGAPAKASRKQQKRKEPHSTPKTSSSTRQKPVPGPEPGQATQFRAAAAASPLPAPFFPGNGPDDDHSTEAAHQPTQARSGEKALALSPRGPPKKQRLDQEEDEEQQYMTPDPPGPKDYHHPENDYTDKDSFSGDSLNGHDWRIHQVKHSKMATNTSVTQYWHWLDNEEMFEHQVLKDVLSKTKVTWGVYKEPIDFHLRLAELTEIIFARCSDKVIIGTKQVTGVAWRGELMAQFKRDRTKRRFLTKMKGLGIKLLKADADFVDSAWNRMQPEVLPSD